MASTSARSMPRRSRPCGESGWSARWSSSRASTSTQPSTSPSRHSSESDALLDFLYDHSVKPEYTVRYHWHDGDIGFWDNRTTQHAVSGDFGDAHRVIQRVTLRGDDPV